MRFKVDENLHPDVARLLCEHGHDAVTVYEQGLRGYSDQKIAAVCHEEGRAIITLDLDFADIRAYPPKAYAGIIVLRVADQSRSAILRIFKGILATLEQESLTGRLWIVDENRIRIRSG